MDGDRFLCPRCGTTLQSAKSSRPPLTLGGEVIAFLSASVLIDVLTMVLVVVGFVYPVAWLVALVLVLFAYGRFRRGERRFHCSSCRIDYPYDMVRSG